MNKCYEITLNGVVVGSGYASEDDFNGGFPEGFEWADPPTPTPVVKRTLTRLEYMDRFTDAELAGIYTAAKSVVQVEVWLEKFKLAEFIDLTDQRTIAGVQSLEAAGLLAAGRAAEILA